MKLQFQRQSEGRRPEIRAGVQGRATDVELDEAFGARNAAFYASENLGTAFDVARFYRSAPVAERVTSVAAWFESVAHKTLGGSSRRSLTLYATSRRS